MSKTQNEWIYEEGVIEGYKKAIKDLTEFTNCLALKASFMSMQSLKAGIEALKTELKFMENF